MTCHRHEVPDNSILRPIAFASKSLTGEEKRYSNIDREALGILYGLEKFHHYCFAREVSIIKDHIPLVTIFKKDVTTLSSESYKVYISTGSESYTSMDQNCSLQTSCPGKITRKIKMMK